MSVDDLLSMQDLVERAMMVGSVEDLLTLICGGLAELLGARQSAYFASSGRELRCVRACELRGGAPSPDPSRLGLLRAGEVPPVVQRVLETGQPAVTHSSPSIPGRPAYGTALQIGLLVGSRHHPPAGVVLLGFDRSRRPDRTAIQLAQVTAGLLGAVVATVGRRESLVHDSRHDPLTGLANRRLLLDHLGEAIAASEQTGDALGLVVLVLEGLKGVSEALGRVRAEELLIHVSRRLRRLLRAGDLVARLGNDEFAVVLPSVEGAGALDQVTARLVTAIEAPFRLSGCTVKITGGVGTAWFPQDGKTVEELLGAADAQIREAKKF